MPQQMVQKLAHHPAKSEELSHGALHWIIEVLPGGEWTVIGLMAFGGSGIVWHRFHKPIEDFIWNIVRRKMDQRKP